MHIHTHDIHAILVCEEVHRSSPRCQLFAEFPNFGSGQKKRFRGLGKVVLPHVHTHRTIRYYISEYDIYIIIYYNHQASSQLTPEFRSEWTTIYNHLDTNI